MATRAGAVRLEAAMAARLSAFSAALYIPIGLSCRFIQSGSRHAGFPIPR